MSSRTSLGRLERVDLRSGWLREDSDFTPWLASEENIALLGDSIGLELEVQQAEAAVGPFRADILCKDTATDELVIIENQLEKTNHSHLGQTLTYAAGLDATTVIWIASEFNEQHRAALDWLNHISHEDFLFFGLEIELWRIGDSAPAPKFNLVAQPNDWSKSVRESAGRSGDLTPAKELRLDFWTEFGIFLQEQGASYKPPKPSTKHWCTWGLGRAGTSLQALALVEELRVNVKVADRKHPSWLPQLREQRESIEAALGFHLRWPEDPETKAVHLVYAQEWDFEDRRGWPKAFAWLLQHMEALDRVFRPRVKALRDEPVEDASEDDDS